MVCHLVRCTCDVSTKLYNNLNNKLNIVGLNRKEIKSKSVGWLQGFDYIQRLKTSSLVLYKDTKKFFTYTRTQYTYAHIPVATQNKVPEINNKSAISSNQHNETLVLITQVCIISYNQCFLNQLENQLCTNCLIFMSRYFYFFFISKF